jgi:hypothetical protein
MAVSLIRRWSSRTLKAHSIFVGSYLISLCLLCHSHFKPMSGPVYTDAFRNEPPDPYCGWDERHGRHKVSFSVRQPSALRSPDRIPFPVSQDECVIAFHHFPRKNKVGLAVFHFRAGERNFVSFVETHTHVVKKRLGT